MSLFKTRTWWTVAQGGGLEEHDRGHLCVAPVEAGPDALPRIITGSFQGLLRIYAPRPGENKPEDLLLEQSLGQPILQIEVGRFIGHEPGLAILHPRKLTVFSVKSISGIGEQGSYLALERRYEHTLERTAGNMTYGPFGGVAGKDFLAVQSMDGMLSVFEQDCFAFSRFLPNFLLPGPLCYVAKLDAFVTSNSVMEVECYRYQLLASSSPSASRRDGGAAPVETGITATKRLQVEWTQNVGEQVVDIFVSRFSRSLTSTQIDIVVLCERSMFCLKESGAIRFQKRFDYPTACCFPYFIGDNAAANNNGGSSESSQQPGHNIQQNMVIASHLGSLMIYRDMQLIWSSKVSCVPVAIRVAKFGGLAGLIVTLDENGTVEVSYLGTDPSNSIVNNPVEGKELNYDEMDKELRSLQLVIREASQTTKVEPNDKIVLRAQEIPIETSPEAITTCFRLYISYTGMDTLQNVNIAISTSDAIKVSQPSLVLDTLAGASSSKTPTVIPLVFQCKTTTLPNERSAIVVAAYTTAKGDARTARLEIMLPLALFCKIVPTIKTSTYKLTIDTSRRGVPLTTLFNDLNNIHAEAIPSVASPDQDAPNIISMQYHCGPDVTIIGSKSSGKYRIQSSHFEAMWLLLSELTSRLLQYWKTSDESPKDPSASPSASPSSSPSSSSREFRVAFTDDLPFQEYFALIDAHFNCRKQLQSMHTDLEKSTFQFRAIQKRLLVRYKDRNAVPLSNMDVLLENTFEEISKLSAKIQSQRKSTKVAACNLACATQLLQRLIRYKFNLDDTSYLILQAYLSARVNDDNTDQQQGWEESTDASLVQLLRTVLAASAQDMATLPVLATLTDTHTLKQHMIMVTDRLAAGGRLYKPSSSSSSSSPTTKKKSSSSSSDKSRGKSSSSSSSSKAPK